MNKWLENLLVNFKCGCGSIVKPIDDDGNYKCSGCGKEYHYSE